MWAELRFEQINAGLKLKDRPSMQLGGLAVTFKIFTWLAINSEQKSLGTGIRLVALVTFGVQIWDVKDPAPYPLPLVK